ncbi:MAG: glycosyltransferase [Alphaproteobacteria bacterium]|nr:MAG: glycosyltransferase [Alphaproteobacteria bacterium]
MIRARFDLLGQSLDLWTPDADYLIAAERAFAAGPLTALMTGMFAAGRPAPGRALCLGAGCGAVPIALALALPGLQVEAVEHHPGLFDALMRNVEEAGLGARIAVRHGIAEAAPRPQLIRSRDAPDFIDLAPAGALEGWMEPLDCPVVTPAPADLVTAAHPLLRPAARAAQRPGAALAARANALDRRRGAVALDLGPAGCSAPMIGHDPGPLLEVVVPVHGVERFVVDCIASLREGMPPEMRVTVVDDGSPDRSVERLRAAFGPDDARLRILSKPNGGCASARNFGIGSSRAPFLGFVDGDDAVEPGFFARLLDAALLTGAPMVQAPFRLLHGDRVEESYEAASFADIPRDRAGRFTVPAAALITGQPAIWRRIYRRGFLDAHGIRFPEHVRAFDDQFFQIACLGRIEAMPMIDGPAYLYRQHPGQDVRQADRRHFHSLETFRDVLVLALREGWETLPELVTAMVHTLNWSGGLLPPPLLGRYAEGAGRLLAWSEKALGAAFPAATWRQLTCAPVRAAWEMQRARLARVPDAAGLAWLEAAALHPWGAAPR